MSKIFLSYAHEQRSLAETVNASLAVRDHQVFFDKESLVAGVAYDTRIEQEIKSADLFIVLLSPNAVADEKYVLTELGIVRRKWRNPSGKVLPVMARPTVLTDVDAYLRAVTICYPQGNFAAEVAIAAETLLKPDSAPREEQFSLDILAPRIDAYRRLWSLTAVLPKWPRDSDVTYDDLQAFSRSLRQWYFTDGGGMFLSRRAHTAYSALQDSLTAVELTARDLGTAGQGRITNKDYDAVRELCSALRTQLTRDVGARK